MADFIFRVKSVELTPVQQNPIATAIQGAVLTELAKLDLGSKPSAADCLFRPITWRGGQMIPPGLLGQAQGTILGVTETPT